MAYTPGNTGTKLDENFENDLLAIADTRLVLGNWYAECVMNGRSLPDFAAILGMCTSNYGHTRAIYQYLAAHGLDHVARPRQVPSLFDSDSRYARDRKRGFPHVFPQHADTRTSHAGDTHLHADSTVAIDFDIPQHARCTGHDARERHSGLTKRN